MGVDLDLTDSFSRLDWVTHLVERIRPIVAAIDHQAKHGELVPEVRGCNQGHDHIRYQIADPFEVPDGLMFTVADIAVNARSCLDMAVQRIFDSYEVRGKQKPQFPIVDDIDHLANPDGDEEAAQRKWMQAYPEAFRRTIRAAQPKYDSPWGRFDVPDNEEALLVREVSNTNKHRNLTPVIRRSGHLSWESSTSGVPVKLSGNESPWSPDTATLLEVHVPPGTATADVVREIKPNGSARLVIQETGYRYGHFEVPVELAKFLDGVAPYVHRTLKALQRTHERIAAVHSGEEADRMS